MTKRISGGLPDRPHGRKTVLLATYWQNEALKRGIIDYARSRGWDVLDLRCYSLKLPRTYRPDGVLCNLPTGYAPLARQLLRLGVPAVQIQDQILPVRCPRVTKDRPAIGRAAAEHFAERGFRRMVYVRSPNWQRDADNLVSESFGEHARRQGAAVHAFELQRPGRPVPWANVHLLAGRLRKKLARIELPVGIFTYHDAMATRICHYLEAAGLSVPEQVAVLGMGNDELTCDCASVPLSSVDPNSLQQGRVAAGLLDRLMDGEPAPEGPVLVPPAGVVTRHSTDVLAVPDATTAKALRYLWGHLAEPLSVRKVAEAVGVSRRKLDQDFRVHLGRSVIEELNRKRIERCCELLTGTGQSVVSIAPQVGFRTEPYLFRVFRKHMGMTPRQYRLAHIASRREAGFRGHPRASRRQAGSGRFLRASPE